jgi:hypothetical protein
MSCDLLTKDVPGPHYQGDVIDIINDGWDLMIAHPPCTYLSNAGARWLYPGGVLNDGRYKRGLHARDFFIYLIASNIKMVCVENPKPSKIYNLPECDQVIQPFQFGHPVSKRTHLWLKNLPELVPTNIVKSEGHLCGSFTSKNKGNKSKQVIGKTWKERSKTYQGIADAMADQWGRS